MLNAKTEMHLILAAVFTGHSVLADVNFVKTPATVLCDNAIEINVQGNNVSIADGDVTPNNADFTNFGGSCLSGSNIVKTFSIQNSGTATMLLISGSITFSGVNASMFTLGGITLPTSIPAGSFKTFTVTFAPSAIGTKTATIHIISDDCDEPDYDFAITAAVNPLPSTVLSGSSVACSNGSQAGTVQLDFATGTGPWNYILFDGTNTVNGSATSNPAVILINCTGYAAGTHTFLLTALTDNYGCSGNRSGTASVLVAGVIPNNAVSAVNIPQFACSGDQGILITANTSSVPAGTYYAWNTGSNSSVVKYSLNAAGPYTTTLNTPTPQVYAQFGALGNSTGYNVCVQAANGCGSSNNKCSWIQGSTNTPASITGPTVACALGSASYSCATVSPASAVYTWSFSVPGATFQNQGQANVGSVTFPAFTTGQLCVTSKLACAGATPSPARCITVSTATAAVGPMTGSKRVCPGATGQVYAVPAITGATYNWTIPPGATITSPAVPSTSNTITLSFPDPYGSFGYSVCVTSTSICGVTTPNRCVNVLSKTPGVPVTLSGPLTALCNQHAVYTAAIPVGEYTGFEWGGTVLSPTPAAGISNIRYNGQSVEFDIAAPFITGTLTVAAVNNTCTPTTGSSPRSITLFSPPARPTDIGQTAPTTICQNFPVTFIATPPPPVSTSYFWYISSGTITGINPNNTGSIAAIWGSSSSGNVQVTARNDCGNSSTLVKLVSAISCREAGADLAEKSIIVYPNPAHDNLTLTINAKATSYCIVTLMDMAGRAVFTEKMTIIAGNNDYQLNISFLPVGVYRMQVQSGADVWNKKIVVQ